MANKMINENSSVRGRALQFVARAIALGVLTIAVPCMVFGPWPATAQTERAGAVAKAQHPDFEGFWELVYGTSQHVPPAKLTTQALARDKKLADDRVAGKVVTYTSRWCNFMGIPFIMENSPPINIVQTDDEIGMYSEFNSAPRHVYLDGRNHPSNSEFKPTTNGHSIGHWEGDELVVDTTSFSANGSREIPGGGYRGTNSHLVERIKLIGGGEEMQITSTWEDPTVFLEPHTYVLVFKKQPPGTYALEGACDASDAVPFENSGGVVDY